MFTKGSSCNNTQISVIHQLKVCVSRFHFVSIHLFLSYNQVGQHLHIAQSAIGMNPQGIVTVSFPTIEKIKKKELISMYIGMLVTHCFVLL